MVDKTEILFKVALNTITLSPKLDTLIRASKDFSYLILHFFNIQP
jgi:hypothetical protein